MFAVGVPVIEGYGLTETAPVLTINPEDRPRLGTVGRPLPRVELRIADDGEILARGPNLMLGYYGKPQATKEVMKDGWFHTGDIGYIDHDGYLIITDRIKDLIITAGGKNVAPQPIEQQLKQDPLIAEVALIGDRRRFISALIVPDYSELGAQVGEPTGAEIADLVERQRVLNLFQSLVDKVNEGRPEYEQVRKFALLPRAFSVEAGELTPTLKVRRRVVDEVWKELIEGLYAEERLKTEY